MEIKDIMSKVVCVDVDTTLEGVIEKMTQEDVNSVMVCGENMELLGSVDIVTLMNAIVPEYIGTRDTSVAKFTTEDVFEGFIKDNKDKKITDFMLDTPKTINQDSPILEACMLTTEGRQSKIPVVDDSNNLVGVITRRGVRKYLSKKMCV